MLEELKNIEKRCINCTKCQLHKTKINTVFFDGIPNNKIMLIGEAPGKEEDAQGKPFVGRSGKLLDEILNFVGFSRNSNIYICNTIKCRPPKNRKPLLKEENACKEFLEQQINILKPKIILLCGSIATKIMLKNNKICITKIHGEWFDGPNNSKMISIFHPAYLLRNPSKKVVSPRWLMYQDMKKIKEEYDKL